MTNSTKELIEQISCNQYTDLIFDFDKTICHLKVEWTSFFDDLDKLAALFSEENLKDESKLHDYLESLLVKYGDDMRLKINDIFLKYESKYLLNVIDNDLLISFIRDNNSHQMHILSNNMTITIEKELKRLGILDKFKNIIGRDKAVISKPNPDAINNIIKDSSGCKIDFLMIGDNPKSDILAAERAGIDSVLIDMYLK